MGFMEYGYAFFGNGYKPFPTRYCNPCAFLAYAIRPYILPVHRLHRRCRLKRTVSASLMPCFLLYLHILMSFCLEHPFTPTGDQPQAIKELVEGLQRGDKHQVLLGATGTGKTFTIANVIAQCNRPALVLAHNKTLAAQLYNEFKSFFPNNLVEYFVSYYDYYQPEAYIPTTNTYIEKDLAINAEIEKLRLSTTSALLCGRKDVLVVSSVSCIYGMGNPESYGQGAVHLQRNQKISRQKLLLDLVTGLYSRTEGDFVRGNFRVKGDTVDVFLAYADFALRIAFWGDEVESITTIDPKTGHSMEDLSHCTIYPANLFVTNRDTLGQIILEIQQDMFAQVEFFNQNKKKEEAKRLAERVNYDLEMIKELGYCSGIENYSRYFDRRAPGVRPYCLLDYFPKDFLMVIDESHVTVPQIRAMYGGDRSRKQNLVEYGFRLPAALDNRPLRFEEFEEICPQSIFVSATPADYEMQQSEGAFVDQVIRPTGLLDPILEVRPTLNQIDDLLQEIHKRIALQERTLVTTLTKRMAEELAKYLDQAGIKCQYIHSEVDTLERVEILQRLRDGILDVLIGVNLLREGLDLPEVSLVVILDADKEGFLRNTRSLIQTIGRAARHVHGMAILYADRTTDSMQRAIDETDRRRKKQAAYNTERGLVPQPIIKPAQLLITQNQQNKADARRATSQKQDLYIDPVLDALQGKDLEKAIAELKKAMKKAAEEHEFMRAATLRDEIARLEKRLG